MSRWEGYPEGSSGSYTLKVVLGVFWGPGEIRLSWEWHVQICVWEGDACGCPERGLRRGWREGKRRNMSCQAMKFSMRAGVTEKRQAICQLHPIIVEGGLGDGMNGGEKHLMMMKKKKRRKKRKQRSRRGLDSLPKPLLLYDLLSHRIKLKAELIGMLPHGNSRIILLKSDLHIAPHLPCVRSNRTCMYWGHPGYFSVVCGWLMIPS